MTDSILSGKPDLCKAEAASLIAQVDVHFWTSTSHFLIACRSRTSPHYGFDLRDILCTYHDEWGLQYRDTCMHREATRLFGRQRLRRDRHALCQIEYRPLTAGWDVTSDCTCGERCFGFGGSVGEAYEICLFAWLEHVRIVREHRRRCPGDWEDDMEVVQ